MVDIPKLRALLAAATPGPWECDLDGGETLPLCYRATGPDVSSVDEACADRDLIKVLVNAAPALLNELERLRRLEAAALAWDSEMDRGFRRRLQAATLAWDSEMARGFSINAAERLDACIAEAREAHDAAKVKP